MPLRSCLDCGAHLILRRTRCHACQRAQDQRRIVRQPERRAYQDPAYRAMGKPDVSSRCWLCGMPGPDTWDHVIPLVKGGTNAMSNLRPAHRACNSAKGGRGAT